MVASRLWKGPQVAGDNPGFRYVTSNKPAMTLHLGVSTHMKNSD